MIAAKQLTLSCSEWGSLSCTENLLVHKENTGDGIVLGTKPHWIKEEHKTHNLLQLDMQIITISNEPDATINSIVKTIEIEMLQISQVAQLPKILRNLETKYIP